MGQDKVLEHIKYILGEGLQKLMDCVRRKQELHIKINPQEEYYKTDEYFWELFIEMAMNSIKSRISIENYENSVKSRGLSDTIKGE